MAPETTRQRENEILSFTFILGSRSSGVVQTYTTLCSEVWEAGIHAVLQNNELFTLQPLSDPRSTLAEPELLFSSLMFSSEYGHVGTK